MARSKTGIEAQVFVNGQIRDDLRAVRAAAGNGTARLDVAVLEVIATATPAGKVLKDVAHKPPNTSIHALGVAPGSVVRITLDGNVIHSGVTHRTKLAIGRSGNVVRVTSSTKPWHVGGPVRGMLVEGRNSSGYVEGEMLIEDDIFFNPSIGGVVVGNKSTRKANAGHHYFMPPGATRTDLGCDFHGQDAKTSDFNASYAPDGDPANAAKTHWTLIQAVSYLLETLNVDRAGVHRAALNPAAPLLEIQLKRASDVGEDLVRPLHNVVIPLGTLLPRALDMLLTPFGFSWKIKHSAVFSFIEFFELGRGVQRTVMYQSGAGQADFATTNVSDINLDVDLAGRFANKITVIGDHKRVEATFTLIPGWNRELDDAVLDDLMRSPESEEHQRVWRTFVMNEAGDYPNENTVHEFAANLDLLTDDARIGRDGQLDEVTPRDVQEFFHHRKRLMPRINQSVDKTPDGDDNTGIRLSWQDGEDGTETPLNEAGHTSNQVGYSILQNEAGIKFTGMAPPLGLVGADDPRVLAKASLDADTRVTVEKTAVASLNPEVVENVLVRPSSFKFNASHNLDNDSTVIEVEQAIDDTPKMEALALDMLDAWNTAEASGSITLIGLDYEHRVGDVVTEIEGRNIDLRLNDTFATAKYPQILSVIWDMTTQEMILGFSSIARTAMPGSVAPAPGPQSPNPFNNFQELGPIMPAGPSFLPRI